ncbi:MAG: hypothetical protein ACK45A_06165 [Planctomyces sp.]
MNTANAENPFLVIPGDIITDRQNPRLLAWILSVAAGTVVGGGVFGALLGFQEPAAVPLFFVIGCVWAAVGSIPSLLVAAVFGFALRSSMSGSVLRIVLGAMCGFSAGIVSAMAFGPMMIVAGAIGALGAVAGVLITDSRHTRSQDAAGF